jgi:hypothetical protein
MEPQLLVLGELTEDGAFGATSLVVVELTGDGEFRVTATDRV